MSAITIDKHIPIPKLGGIIGAKFKYPWLTLAIGESFFVPDKSITNFSPTVCHAARRVGRKFTCRTQGNGVRVWRIA
jgi:hypothetical protein